MYQSSLLTWLERSYPGWQSSTDLLGINRSHCTSDKKKKQPVINTMHVTLPLSILKNELNLRMEIIKESRKIISLSP